MSKSVNTIAVRNVPNWPALRPRVTKKLLQGITRRIVDEFQPHKIVLFGSHAGGSPGLFSDLDLLVVMSSRQPIARRMEKVARVAHVPFLPMDVLVLTPAEVRARLKSGDAFLSEVLSRGKVLYQRESR